MDPHSHIYDVILENNRLHIITHGNNNLGILFIYEQVFSMKLALER